MIVFVPNICLIFHRQINERLNVEESIADSGGLWQAFQALLEEYGGEEDGWSELEEPTSVNGISLNRGQLFFVTYAQVFDVFWNRLLFAFSLPHCSLQWCGKFHCLFLSIKL